MGDEAYLARLKALRQQRDVIVEGTLAGLPAERAIEWLRVFCNALATTEKSKEKADVLHAIYDRTRLTTTTASLRWLSLRPLR